MEYAQGSMFKKANNKGKDNKLRPKGEYLRSRSSKGNALIVGSKVTNLQFVDCQRGSNLGKLMWFMASPRICLTLASQQ